MDDRRLAADSGVLEQSRMHKPDKYAEQAARFRRIIADLRPDLEANLHENFPIATLCTMRVGGPADFYAAPESVSELADLLRACHQSHYPGMLIGCGSNLIFADEGYRGLLINSRLGLRNLRMADPVEEADLLQMLPLTQGLGNNDWAQNDAQKLEQRDQHRDDQKAAGAAEGRARVIFAEAGVSLAELADFACAMGLTGLEFASGIPGTVGGAVYMNAGAYGSAISDVCLQANALDSEGRSKSYPHTELKFGYRDSLFKHLDEYVVSACFLVREGDKQQIAARMQELNNRRAKSQPLEMPSAGSVFKRPKGYYAGKLVMDSGLQGASVGGAQVSTKHAGFIVNTGGAQCADIIALITKIRQTVYARFGVRIEPEVCVLDRDGKVMEWPDPLS